VKYRPIAKWWLCKRRQFLGDGSINKLRLQRMRAQQYSSIVSRVFLRGPSQDSYKQGTKSVFRQFYTRGCEYRTWAREAEGSPLLETVARKRLVDTAHWKRLSGCCGDLCIIVKFSGDSVIIWIYESCVSGQQIESPIRIPFVVTSTRDNIIAYKPIAKQRPLNK
jgi:hypothetical protein